MKKSSIHKYTYVCIFSDIDNDINSLSVCNDYKLDIIMKLMQLSLQLKSL